MQETRSSCLSPFVLWAAGRGLGDTKGLQVPQYGSPLSHSPALACFSVGSHSAQLFMSPFYVPSPLPFCVFFLRVGGCFALFLPLSTLPSLVLCPICWGKHEKGREEVPKKAGFFQRRPARLLQTSSSPTAPEVWVRQVGGHTSIKGELLSLLGAPSRAPAPQPPGARGHAPLPACRLLQGSVGPSCC